MTYKKKVTLDLSTCSIFANVSKFVELLSSYSNDNFEVSIIRKNWKKIGFKGVKYNKENEIYSKTSGNYLWDPSTHPDDYLENLVFKSFQNLKFKKEINLFEKIFNIFNRSYISYISCLSMTSPTEERARLRKYFFGILKKNFNLRNFIIYVIRSFEFEFSRFYKTKPKQFMPFRYKLSKELDNEIVKNILNRHKNNKKKILLSVLWDEKKKFEILNDRLKGGPKFKENLDQDFEKLKKLVKSIDENILKGKNYQFVLASKKAVDWENYIKSDFIDLRNFEELNLTLSQMIYISQELSSYTINWPSTFTIWVTNCSHIKHLTFHDFKDTAVWCRDNLNNENLKLFN